MAPGGLPANQAGSLRCYFKGQATKKEHPFVRIRVAGVCLRSTREGFCCSACLQPSLQRKAAAAQPRCRRTPASSHPSRRRVPPRAESRSWAGVVPRQLPPAQRNALNKDPKSLFAVEGRVSHACAPRC